MDPVSPDPSKLPRDSRAAPHEPSDEAHSSEEHENEQDGDQESESYVTAQIPVSQPISQPTAAMQATKAAIFTAAGLASSVLLKAWATLQRLTARFLANPWVQKLSIGDDLTVRSSLRIAFASVLAGAVVIGVFSLFQMGRLNGSTQGIFDQEYTAGLATEQVRSQLLRASRAQKQLLTATTADERVALGNDVAVSITQISEHIATVQKLANTPESKALTQQLADALGGWFKRMRGFVVMIKAQPLELLEMNWEVPLEDAGLLNDTRKLEKIVDAMVKQRSESAQSTIAQASSIYRTSLILVTLSTGALVLLALGMGKWVTRRIDRQLGGEPAYAKEIASRIAEGELSMQIKIAPDDSDSLLYSLREMQERLAQTISEIAGSSKLVANASREISMGNLDLSHRTEQQSASLEKTTSNVEQMAAISKRYADSATQAAELSGSANRAALQGGEVVANVVQTMEKIRQSTLAIHTNIGSIQSIAFRTNILALNAAVEAAHAGELGRGFAVVAAEVRDLAQRSAAAAKEISGLVEVSAGQVKEGSKLAQSAGATIAQMAQTVKQVSVVMEEISGASLEQSAGIGEINQAISQLDESTQQNAALVEEGAAAAQSLDEQAQALDQLVGRFTL